MDTIYHLSHFGRVHMHVMDLFLGTYNSSLLIIDDLLKVHCYILLLLVTMYTILVYCQVLLH